MKNERGSHTGRREMPLLETPHQDSAMTFAPQVVEEEPTATLLLLCLQSHNCSFKEWPWGAPCPALLLSPSC